MSYKHTMIIFVTPILNNKSAFFNKLPDVDEAHASTTCTVYNDGSLSTGLHHCINYALLSIEAK